MKPIKPILKLYNIIICFVLLITSVYALEITGTKDNSINSTRSSASQFSFYAVYDNLVNTESNNINCETAAMCADGNKIIFSCKNNTTDDLLLYTINTDGSNLTAIPLPGDLTSIQQVAINKDGSRAFFHQGMQIYKVVGSTATKIYDYEDHPELGGFYSIQITALGEYIYINTASSYSTGSIWKMDQTGAGIVRVFEYKDVQRDGGTGAGIHKFAISDDASVITFILRGYHDSENKFHYKYELFTMDGSGFHQLTNDNENILKDYLAISGDGSTIVFSSSSPDNEWYGIQSDGSNKISLDDKYADVFGPVLNFDGSKMFYNDDGTEGGRLVYTDGSKRIDLFPQTYPYYLNMHGGLSVNEDGSMISFIYKYGYDYYGLYVGYINPSLIVLDVPSIENISFNLPAMPNNDPDAKIILTSQISDPQGLDDIQSTATDILLNGVREAAGSPKTPVRFFDAINDDGTEPDQAADDGIFCSEGIPGPTIDLYTSVAVRVGAMDMNRNAVVADTILNIGEGFVNVGDYEKIHAKFKLYQNYPNPFNPTTKIKYSIPSVETRHASSLQHVTLEVFDILGRVVVVLVNEEKSPGDYEVEFSAKGRSASGKNPVFGIRKLVSGIYFYQLRAEDFTETKKMLLLK